MSTDMPTPEGEAPPVSDVKELPESKRMANIGCEITLKKLDRKVTVRELTMESVIRCAGELAQLLSVIDFSDNTQAAVVLQLVLQSEPTARAARVFAAESTGTTPEDWVEAPASDWLRFIKAARDVHDWEEMRELFMELGLAQMLSRFRAPTTAQAKSAVGSKTPQPS